MIITDSFFAPSDFIISYKTPVLPVIIDRIFWYHLIPLNKVQARLTFKVRVSYSTKGQPSGYRPFWWEKQKGRSGNSEHTFGDRGSDENNEDQVVNSKGGCDITCDNFADNKDALLQALIDETDYTRFAVYNTFIHADYKDTYKNKRQLFRTEIDPDSGNVEWVYEKEIK